MKRNAAHFAAAAILGVHGVYAFRHGWRAMSLPLEAGGIFFALLIGLPLLGVGVFFLAFAVIAVVPVDAPFQPVIGLTVIVLFDMLFLAQGGTGTIFTLSLVVTIVTAIALVLTEARTLGR